MFLLWYYQKKSTAWEREKILEMGEPLFKVLVVKSQSFRII